MKITFCIILRNIHFRSDMGREKKKSRSEEKAKPDFDYVIAEGIAVMEGLRARYAVHGYYGSVEELARVVNRKFCFLSRTYIFQEK